MISCKKKSIMQFHLVFIILFFSSFFLRENTLHFFYTNITLGLRISFRTSPTRVMLEQSKEKKKNTNYTKYDSMPVCVQRFTFEKLGET